MTSWQAPSEGIRHGIGGPPQERLEGSRRPKAGPVAGRGRGSDIPKLGRPTEVSQRGAFAGRSRIERQLWWEGEPAGLLKPCSSRWRGFFRLMRDENFRSTFWDRSLFVIVSSAFLVEASLTGWPFYYALALIGWVVQAASPRADRTYKMCYWILGFMPCLVRAITVTSLGVHSSPFFVVASVVPFWAIGSVLAVRWLGRDFPVAIAFLILLANLVVVPH